jgi:hypothetical protein
MVVRFKADAYIRHSASSMPSHSQSDAIDGLTSTVSTLSISSPSSEADAPDLRVIRGGVVIPQIQTLELSTISEGRQPDFPWQETHSKLFLSQTPNLFIGIHRIGKFVRIKKLKLGTRDFEKSEKRMQANYRKLVLALKAIQKIVVKGGEQGRLTLVCKKGELKVFSRASQQSLLPDEFIERFRS